MFTGPADVVLVSGGGTISVSPVGVINAYGPGEVRGDDTDADVGENPPESSGLETADEGTSGSLSFTRCPEPLADDETM